MYILNKVFKLKGKQLVGVLRSQVPPYKLWPLIKLLNIHPSLFRALTSPIVGQEKGEPDLMI